MGLSQKSINKAALSIGMSWLAQCGACLLAFLATLNLVLAARRIDKEIAQLNLGAAGRRGSKSHLHAPGSHHSQGHHHHHHHAHHAHKEQGTRSTGNSPVPI
jgi:ABC-type nickel/cobalt efflux system permease component RcnA